MPALMYLMGERAWWLPKWRDRMLPNIDIEGENLDRPHLADHYRDNAPEPVTSGHRARCHLPGK